MPSASAVASQARPSSSVCSVFGSEYPAGQGFVLIQERKENKQCRCRWSGEALAHLRDVVDDVLVFVLSADKAGLLQAAEVPLDFPLLLLQRQLAVLQDGRAALQAFWGLSVLNGPPLRHLRMLRLLQYRKPS